MKIIGCDFHPSFQQIAMVDTESGEHTEKRLVPTEAAEFYGQLQGPVLVGMESCGNALWFERLLARLGHQLWVGDASKIRLSEVRKQKTDRRDASCYCNCCWTSAFPGSGCRAWNSVMCGSCCCIVTSWWGCDDRSRRSCNIWR